MALDIGELSQLISGGEKPDYTEKQYTRLTDDQRSRRNDKIRMLALKGNSIRDIYDELYSLGLITDNDGVTQSINSITVNVCRIRKELRINVERVNVVRFQRLKGKGFGKARIIDIMGITNRSYKYTLAKYWHEKIFTPDHEKKVDITNNIRSKAFKMMRLGYDKNKIRAHLQLTCGQYRIIRTRLCEQQRRKL